MRRNEAVKGALSDRFLYADLSKEGEPLSFEDDAFRQPLQKLVGALVELLKTMRDESPAVYVSLPRISGADMTLKTLELLEDLSQAGYRRTSEIHPHHRTNSELEQEIRNALLSVHLVKDPGGSPTVSQIEAAKRAGVPRAVWLSESARVLRGLKDIQEGCRD